jgi:hypothetical protein
MAAARREDYNTGVALHSWCRPLPQSQSPDLADIKRAEQDVRTRPRVPTMPTIAVSCLPADCFLALSFRLTDLPA